MTESEAATDLSITNRLMSNRAPPQLMNGQLTNGQLTNGQLENGQLANGQLTNGQFESTGNGFVHNQSQPTPTPVPPIPDTADLPTTNGELRRKQIVWMQPASHDLQELHKIGGTLKPGLALAKDAYSKEKVSTTSSTDVKYISLATPLNSSSAGGGLTSQTKYLRRSYEEPYQLASADSTVLHALPMRPTLHKQKQVQGRFFPSPSYTEFQRDVLESRPTPRRIIRKFKPNHNKMMFPAGSPVKPKTVGDGYSRSAVVSLPNSLTTTTHSAYRAADELPPSQSRQYSIPASTVFHDGNNNAALVTGNSIALFNKPASNDVNRQQQW